MKSNWLSIIVFAVVAAVAAQALAGFENGLSATGVAAGMFGAAIGYIIFARSKDD